MFNKIWNFLTKYSFPLKLFFSLIVSGFLSSNFLVYLSKLATYNYSRYYRIRFPLEGIPHLEDAILYGGFLLTFIMAISFAYTVFMSTKVRQSYLSVQQKIKENIEKYYDFIDYKETIKLRKILMFEKYPTKVRVSAFILISLFTFLLLYISSGQERSLTQLLIIYCFFLFCFLNSLIIPNKKSIWVNAATSTLIIFFCAVGVIFHPPTYARILRFCRYGGGFPVTLIVNINENNGTQEYNGSLLFRTPDSYIFYDTKDKQIKEFRINDSIMTYPFNSFEKYYLPR